MLIIIACYTYRKILAFKSYSLVTYSNNKIKLASLYIQYDYAQTPPI